MFKLIDKHLAQRRKLAIAAVDTIDEGIFANIRESRNIIFLAVFGIMIILTVPPSLLSKLGLWEIGVDFVPRARSDFDYLYRSGSSEFALAYLNGFILQLSLSAIIFMSLIARYVISGRIAHKTSLLSARIRLIIYLLITLMFTIYTVFI